MSDTPRLEFLGAGGVSNAPRLEFFGAGEMSDAPRLEFLGAGGVSDAPRLEFLGAEGVSDVLDRVAEAVRVVVSWVNAPRVPSAVMGDVLYPVGDGINLALLQGQLESQSRLAFIKLTVLHVLNMKNTTHGPQLNVPHTYIS